LVAKAGGPRPAFCSRSGAVGAAWWMMGRWKWWELDDPWNWENPR